MSYLKKIGDLTVNIVKKENTIEEILKSSTNYEKHITYLKIQNDKQ